MSGPDAVRPLLAARAANDPSARKLLEMFERADETLAARSLESTQTGLRKANQATDVGENLSPRHVYFG